MTPWYEQPEPARLLAAIRIERPSFNTVRAHAWTDQRRCHFRGENARRFRQMWEAELEKAMDAGSHAAVAQLRNREHPDDVIERVLNEDAALTEVHGDPLKGLAA